MDSAADLRSIRDFIRFGASQFRAAGLTFGHGTDNAFDEAAWLVLHSLALPLDLPESWWDSRLTPSERLRVEAVLRERVNSRRPAAYITREAWFMGMPFYVDERVLVPRSPIAELIAAGFSPWLEPDRVRRVLDLCAGSGCIGLAAAAVLPEAEVWLSDLSRDALAVARENVRRHGLEARTRLVQSDVFSALEEGIGFDLIVSNPPYVDAAEMAALAPEYRQEPALGLAAGADGLDIVRRILAGARSRLHPGGVLIVEVGNSQPALEAAFPDLPFTWLEFEGGGEGVFLLTHDQLPAAS
ncbi:50S ribosomal protein L3 N(5)-glutamine methyltransferase [Thioalkalivibrio paradoxus]|uniref:Ribosomal protein uL3 glutamine methyltransferase n=1 Tax=Thioalkalivibrio paradoxus ARh 1 TaxID=713585 RepID=W0DP53_9GAMM|nr:50S ribosomal protein L3 N(5)-glutamine methyltransferase [Thioalkalivibrio paradoxus]AHE99037.1 N5-glutamine S-adenosyl-L-methionine-dependent methyltransferase [Thioalkalivibrio paradoxus ARh 1]